MQTEQTKVSNYLFIGRDKARTARNLAEQMDISPREVSTLVERERRAGIPICATTDANRPGYYLAADEDDLRQYCNRLRKRAGEIFKTRGALLAAADLMAAQNAPGRPQSDETR